MELEEAPVSPGTTAVDSESPQSPKEGISRTWSMGSYPKLSRFMGSRPDVAIFRRFGTLNVESLLCLQSELAHKENRLQKLREREERAEDEKGLAAQRSWYKSSVNPSTTRVTTASSTNL